MKQKNVVKHSTISLRIWQTNRSVSKDTSLHKQINSWHCLSKNVLQKYSFFALVYKFFCLSKIVRSLMSTKKSI
jgi:hypothetical protein